MPGASRRRFPAWVSSYVTTSPLAGVPTALMSTAAMPTLARAAVPIMLVFISVLVYEAEVGDQHQGNELNRVRLGRRTYEPSGLDTERIVVTSNVGSLLTFAFSARVFAKFGRVSQSLYSIEGSRRK